MPSTTLQNNNHSSYFSNKYLLIVAALLIFLFFAVWSSLTTRPESDEGSFANPAYNLAYNGFFGTTVFEMEDTTLTRIDQRTYWVMPLFLLNVSLFFKIFGFSLFAARLVSIFWGVVLILSWSAIVFKISGDKIKAGFCALFLSCSYVILTTASLGRGDTMCAALGFAAFAVYLWLRERNLLLAIFISQCLVTAAGLTHFLGLLAFFGLLFLTLFYDFRSIGFKQIAVALIPYLIGGTAFGLWIWQDPQAFKDQFITNALMGGRMSSMSSPFSGFVNEFTLRYPRAFGLLDHSAGHSGPIFLKSLILVGYAVGVLGVLFVSELRKNNKVILILMTIYFVVLSLIDGQKLAVYLIYIIPFYTVLLAILIYTVYEKRWIPRPLTALGIAGFILLQVGGAALRCRQNTYGYYRETAEFLNSNVGENDLVIGSQNLIFGLKPSTRFVADGKYGYKTGKRAEYIVFDPGVDDAWKASKTFDPEVYEYIPRLLKEEYQLVYENTAFRVYKKL